MKRKNLILIIFFLVELLSSCGNYVSEIPTKPIDYSAYLEIVYSDGKILDQFNSIGVMVKNTSGYCFSFPYDFGIQTYIYNNNKWSEITITVTYLPKENNIIQPDNDPLFSVEHILIQPDINNLPIKEKTYFKAIIKGNLCAQPEIIVEKEILFYALP